MLKDKGVARVTAVDTCLFLEGNVHLGRAFSIPYIVPVEFACLVWNGCHFDVCFHVVVTRWSFNDSFGMI